MDTLWQISSFLIVLSQDDSCEREEDLRVLTAGLLADRLSVSTIDFTTLRVHLAAGLPLVLPTLLSPFVSTCL